MAGKTPYGEKTGGKNLAVKGTGEKTDGKRPAGKLPSTGDTHLVDDFNGRIF